MSFYPSKATPVGEQEMLATDDGRIPNLVFPRHGQSAHSILPVYLKDDFDPGYFLLGAVRRLEHRLRSRVERKEGSRE